MDLISIEGVNSIIIRDKSLIHVDTTQTTKNNIVILLTLFISMYIL